MKSRYDNWVEHINWDWCISRQRFFGIPFPCWHCTQCQTVILATADQLPLDPQETVYQGACPQCGSDTVVPDTDVMDTWNTSSLTPEICKQMFESTYQKANNDFLPMSMRPQAHDIIRTWAFDTIVKSWMHHQQIPWHDIVISGHVLSTEKSKISKSQGNSPLEPENLLKAYPADVIRYWAAGAQLGTDTAFAENQFKIGQRLVVKLWNACLFIKEHACKGDLNNLQNPVNRWIMHQASETFAAYTKAFNEYHFHKALECVERFFWQDWCDNYLELIKDQFFNPTQYTPELIKETRAVLYAIGFELLQWYAPFLPYVTEAIYQELYKVDFKTNSLHQTLYISGNNIHHYPHALTTTEVLLKVVQQVRKLKTDATLSLKTDLSKLTVICSPEAHQQLMMVEKIIAGVARATHIEYRLSSVEATSEELQLIEDNGIYSAVVAV